MYFSAKMEDILLGMWPILNERIKLSPIAPRKGHGQFKQFYIITIFFPTRHLQRICKDIESVTDAIDSMISSVQSSFKRLVRYAARYAKEDEGYNWRLTGFERHPTVDGWSALLICQRWDENKVSLGT